MFLVGYHCLGVDGRSGSWARETKSTSLWPPRRGSLRNPDHANAAPRMPNLGTGRYFPCPADSSALRDYTRLRQDLPPRAGQSMCSQHYVKSERRIQRLSELFFASMMNVGEHADCPGLCRGVRLQQRLFNPVRSRGGRRLICPRCRLRSPGSLGHFHPKGRFVKLLPNLLSQSQKCFHSAL